MCGRITRRSVVLATYGYNEVTKKPFKLLYEFGYYTTNGCVVYNQGERNMQDAHEFKMEQIILANETDIERYSWGR